MLSVTEVLYHFLFQNNALFRATHLHFFCSSLLLDFHPVLHTCGSNAVGVNEALNNLRKITYSSETKSEKRKMKKSQFPWEKSLSVCDNPCFLGR